MPSLHSIQRRVLIVADSLANGGAERQLVLLATRLPEEWSCIVVALAEGPYRGVLSHAGCRFVVMERKWRWDVLPFVRLMLLIARLRPDVVHCWSGMSTLASYPACRLLGIPILNGSIRMGSRGQKSLRTWLSLRVADRIVANSRAGLAAWRIPLHKGRVVYNGFDFERLRGSARHVAVPSTTYAVVMAARMAKRKDFDTFFASARLLHEHSASRDWLFIAVGDGSERQGLLSRNSDLIEEGVAMFPLPSVEIIDVILGSRVGVLMTNSDCHAEGCSNSLLEYMACGLPVVCNDTGGTSEVVVDGVTGILIPSRSEQGLADALFRLRDDEEEARRLGEAGRELVHRRFSVSAMVEGMTAIYDDMCRHSTRRANVRGAATEQRGSQSCLADDRDRECRRAGETIHSMLHYLLCARVPAVSRILDALVFVVCGARVPQDAAIGEGTVLARGGNGVVR